MNEQTAGCNLIAEARHLYERCLHAPNGLTIAEDHRLHGILTIDLPAWVKRAEQAEAEQDRLREALDYTERDARWIVGQHQRLLDEPVKTVALAIVDRCREALKPRATDGSGE